MAVARNLAVRIERRAVRAAQRPDQLRVIFLCRVPRCKAVRQYLSTQPRSAPVAASGSTVDRGAPWYAAMDSGGHLPKPPHATEVGSGKPQPSPGLYRSAAAFGSRPARSAALRVSHFFSHASLPIGSSWLTAGAQPTVRSCACR